MGSTKDLDSPFQDWITEELNKRGWTMAELARHAGVHQSAIGQVMRKSKALGVKLAQSIAAALDVPEDIVFEMGGLKSTTGDKPTIAENELLYIFRKFDVDERDLLISQARAILRHRRRNNASSGENVSETNKKPKRG